MTSQENSPDARKATTRKYLPRTRSFSASEIARNVKHFETWSTYQCCEQVSYSDIPQDMKADINQVFDVTGRLPLAWTVKTTKEFKYLSQCFPPELIDFIQIAYKQSPTLFTDTSLIEPTELLTEVSIVFSAWRRLLWMRKSKEKWSEADYAANVYNVFRSPAIRGSVHRVHCTISLPQPLLRDNMNVLAKRLLNAKTAAPDSVILLPAATIRALSHSAKSPFKRLKGHTAALQNEKGTSFRYQSTPFLALPDTPGFEFASTFWEDKKPVYPLLEDAYRQNRMATAAALRHLHSLSVVSPVFGLIWASGTVRSHVDWCRVDQGKPPFIFSAPYPGSAEDIFHEWQLDRPSDILAVYFLIRNLDAWTMSGFYSRVVKGINELVDAVVNKREAYVPWKHVGDFTFPLSTTRKENVSASDSTQSISPKRVPRRRHGQGRLQ